jgi:chorismate synthase
MMALVLMDHALLHRAQNADVKTKTPKIPESIKQATSSSKNTPSSKSLPRSR